MRSNKRLVTTKTPTQLAAALGLPPSAGVEIQVRSELNDRLIKIVQSEGITHAQLARLSGASRTRITAILNRSLEEVSTDLLLRLLGSLGYVVRLNVRRNRPRAA